MGAGQDILVARVARPPRSDETVMVGWYENATVYGTCQHFSGDPSRILPNGSYEYFAEAKELDKIIYKEYLQFNQLLMVYFL